MKLKKSLLFSVSILFFINLFSQKPIGENWLKTDVPTKDAICFALYTVQDSTLKMTVQLYPLKDGVDRVVKLQIRNGNQWKTMAATLVSEASYGWPQEDKKRWTAHFRLEKLGPQQGLPIQSNCCRWSGNV